MLPTLDSLRLVLLCALVSACGDKEETTDPVDSGVYNPDGGDGVDGVDGTGGTSTSTACTGSTPILLDDGSPSGFEACDDGAVHRVSAEPAPTTIGADRCRGDEAELSCEVDSDCTARPNGACLSQYPFYAEFDYCSCVYACGSDADCDAGQLCLPAGVVDNGESWSTCVDAACTTDADCGSGECGVSSWFDGCGTITGAQCREPDDDVCRSDSDCADGEECGVRWSLDEPYACYSEECAIGRPVLVADEPGSRRAPVSAREDWSQPVPAAPVLEPAVRARLAAHWSVVAQLEHASVASFARVTLQLLALGAPADLLADTQRAAADEVEHARLAFGLASAYQGAPVGPGPLDLSGAAPALDARSALFALVDEACVGETLGAAEAAEAARRCTDPAVAAVLQRIARDEARHAALAWRTLRWLLSVHPELAPAAATRLDAAVTRLTRVPTGGDATLARHGVLQGDALRALRAAAARTVVAACRAAVFDGGARAA